MAYNVVNKKDYPGWGHMLESGATTLWESWRKPDQNSQNHPMFGSVSEWFYRSLLGINPAAAGFEKIIIKPQPAGDLTWAKGSYQSVRGSIVSDWKKTGKQFQLNVSIPANTTAEIWIPATMNDTITESEKTLNDQNLKVGRYQNGYAVIEIGSGSYTFKKR
jgi:alpha-L-rhamnosidase